MSLNVSYMLDNSEFTNTGMRTGKKKEHIVLDGLTCESITKWLDDIGLPQYKHQFYEARVDGRVLNQMTIVSGIVSSVGLSTELIYI